jgi:Domain of unknown function (DUF4372)
VAFAQPTFRESPRDIDTCLRVVEPKLYHAGFRAKVSRSSLAVANRTHVWQIFADFAQVLICRARKLKVNEPFGVELDQTVYAIDSTKIHLRLSPSPGRKSNRLNGTTSSSRKGRVCNSQTP